MTLTTVPASPARLHRIIRDWRQGAEPLVTASPLTSWLREKLGENLLKDTVLLGAALLSAAESLRAARAGG